jgi:hypothetical protein
MLLTEIAAQSFDYKLIASSDKLFKTQKRINDRLVVFSASAYSPTEWLIEFEELDDKGRGTYAVTGSGGEFKVFGFVLSSLSEFVQLYHPLSISFSAEKESEDDVRPIVYEKLIKRSLKGFLKGYELKIAKRDSHDTFELVKT